MKLKKFPILFSALCLIASCHARETDRVNRTANILKFERAITLPGVKGRIDHIAIDLRRQKVFIAALGNNSVEAVDLQKGAVVFSIKDIGEPQGIVFIPDSTICVSSGESGECIFFNSNTFARLTTVKIGSDADNLRYDSTQNVVYGGYGNGGIAVIDAVNFNLLSAVTLHGHPEAFQFENQHPFLLRYSIYRGMVL